MPPRLDARGRRNPRTPSALHCFFIPVPVPFRANPLFVDFRAGEEEEKDPGQRSPPSVLLNQWNISGPSFPFLAVVTEASPSSPDSFSRSSPSLLMRLNWA